MNFKCKFKVSKIIVRQFFNPLTHLKTIQNMQIFSVNKKYDENRESLT